MTREEEDVLETIASRARVLLTLPSDVEWLVKKVRECQEMDARTESQALSWCRVFRLCEELGMPMTAEMGERQVTEFIKGRHWKSHQECELNEAMSALRSLTPGGSEYQTVAECLKAARDIRDMQAASLSKFKRERDKAMSALRSLTAVFCNLGAAQETDPWDTIEQSETQAGGE
jgi:hypothetical protein